LESASASRRHGNLQENTMKFFCLAYGSEQDWKDLGPDRQQTLLEADERLRRRGALMAAVEPAVSTVRSRDEALDMTSGPFARTQIPLAGFSVIEADSLEQAVQLVAGTPCARAKGAIEIRKILFINDVEWKER
jgi:hypothetical protein